MCKLGLNGKKSVLYGFCRDFLGYLCRILMIFSILQTCINYMAFFPATDWHRFVLKEGGFLDVGKSKRFIWRLDKKIRSPNKQILGSDFLVSFTADLCDSTVLYLSSFARMAAICAFISAFSCLSASICFACERISWDCVSSCFDCASMTLAICVFIRCRAASSHPCDGIRDSGDASYSMI